MTSFNSVGGNLIGIVSHNRTLSGGQWNHALGGTLRLRNGLFLSPLIYRVDGII
ncbi:hypothetical protein [Agrobacterium vaccinii]|uniref:hypothetical protein n=1 Tax=Agrobacterium vaccinii TaxID=2735528 RepID=UPI001E36DC09|nr:hypothetical protein [Agrobacterium vaccinii]